MEYTVEQKYQLIKDNLLNQTSKNPISIVKSLMHSDFINIHGPEHHFLDGAAFMDNENPVIVYTGRYKRLDNFWFTLAHEIAHVLLHLKEDLCFMDDDSHQNDELEVEANALAQKQLKHDEIVKYFSDHTGYMTQSRLNLAAATLGVNRSIIIGSLAHDGKVNYNQIINTNKTNPLELISECYIVK